MKMCDSYCWLTELRKNQARSHARYTFFDQCSHLVWKATENSLTFYKAWGDGCCRGCTSWCVKHCYMNIKEFLQEERKKINKAWHLPTYDVCGNGEMPFHNDISNAKYVTFFGSGTINHAHDIAFVKGTIEHYPNKHYRIFIRDLEFIEEFYGNQIIMSVDVGTNKHIIAKALNNKNINVAILNHPDNAELIKELKSKIPVVLNCEECMQGGYSKQHCFHEQNRFLSIQNYEEVENYV